MANIEIVDPGYSTIKWEEVGQIVEGYYKGTREIKMGSQVSHVHLLYDDSFNEIECFGAGELNRKLQAVKQQFPGDPYVYILYNGRDEKARHTFTVTLDKDRIKTDL